MTSSLQAPRLSPRHTPAILSSTAFPTRICPHGSGAGAAGAHALAQLLDDLSLSDEFTTGKLLQITDAG